MKAKLIVEGKEFDIDILDPELQKLVKPQKKTGYERVGYMDCFHSVYGDGHIGKDEDARGGFSQHRYDIANYYSDKIVAENNARADRLMRQLRRFAVEHREKEINWNNRFGLSFIGFGIDNNDLIVLNVGWARYAGQVVFDSANTAQEAINTFHDELIWYFTEYKDSL